MTVEVVDGATYRCSICHAGRAVIEKMKRLAEAAWVERAYQPHAQDGCAGMFWVR